MKTREGTGERRKREGREAHLRDHVDEHEEGERLRALLGQIVGERAVGHELGDDVDGLRFGAHAEQPHDLRVRHLVHALRLFDELIRGLLARAVLLLHRSAQSRAVRTLQVNLELREEGETCTLLLS